MRTLIENGTVVTASDTFAADVVIEDDRIAALGKDLGRVYAQIDRRIDARGKYVIPGGIDVHTHLDMPFGGTTSADDFETGTIAAAHGGTTTLVDFAIQPQGGSLNQGIAAWHHKGGAKARGETAPVWHALTRPPRLEGEASHRVLALAEVARVPLYIVHLSAAEALEQVRMARDRGVRAYAETCPQYLFLDQRNYEEPGFA